ncbi:eukaryotic translation initiation factor 5 [Coemansia spiralis]|uniref:Eukaryotic translation initiation factor 5 n=2 Tax=Coemansia TaxID=4863 RepID=A0A9W8G3A2_9FUNG|nr:domain found in IF2B/IF5-domain-containing protein [Coemansia spiralis]KAJ1992771.1 eukaryotic translation initiation factor 5 [Coemansia umbellata]KAJ2622572.1 eukaryotic translation initiation factor 5 [Coemansia sp. RSA 1358]KAJ2670296.1 eukaryotic translation initiation factor 5 [Coemansia spiralis]
MANMVNICRDNEDPFYRYQMPKMQGKIEGKGNGIKTVLPNITDVARALSRPPSYATKYFGTELGAQTKMDEKNEKYIVNGAHEVSKLQDILDGFIDKFVLCGNCKCPETDLIVKDQFIVKKCKACGKRTDVDMRHKLTTFILKNPPEEVKEARVHANGDADEQLADKAAALDINDDDDDWDAGIDMSEEAVAQRQRELGGIFTSEEDPYDQLGDYIKATPTATSRDIHHKATELGLGKKHRALVVVIQCLFENPTSSLVKDIQKHSSLLMLFGRSDKHQRAIIGGFERIIEGQDALLAKTSSIFKALFDEEVVDEEVFLEWGKKPSKKYVEKDVAKKIHKAAQPFLTWLEEAEEESDSE